MQGEGDLEGGLDRRATALFERPQRQLLEQLPVVTYVADLTWSRLYFVNRHVEELFGYPVDEWLGNAQLRADRLHPKDRYRVLHERAQARANDEGFSSDYRVLSGHGRIVWVRDEAVLVRDANGAPLYWQGCLLDFTERRIAEDELRKRAAQQSALATVSQLALADTEQSRLFRETVEVVAETLGVEHCVLFHSEGQDDVLTPLAATSSASPAEPPAPGSLADHAMTTGTVAVVADRRYERHRPALLHDEAVSGAAVPIECANPARAVLTCESRSPRVFTRDDVRFLESVANVLASALSRQATEAQLGQALKMNALGRLAAGIAHDFNNILGAIHGFSELLGPVVEPDPRARAHLAELQAAAQRAAGLVEQLLTFARQRRGRPVPIDVQGVIAGLEPMLASLLGSKVRLRREGQPGLPAVRADRHQLEQVVMNLVLNARDAMPEGGDIVVRTRTVELEGRGRDTLDLAAGEYVAIDVEDTGTGMDADTIAQIFEPFFSTKAPGKGTGLGLSTVFGIARRHGGGVEVDSEPGRGTRMTVYLPQEQAQVEAVTSVPPAPPGPSPRDPSDKATVVLVDDQQAVRTLVGEILTERGYEVVEAADGQECLEALRERDEPVDLLLTDVTMPGMTGPELVERLRASRPGLRVVYMSGYSDVPGLDGVAGEQHIRLIRKPFTLTELVDTVAQALTENA